MVWIVNDVAVQFAHNDYDSTISGEPKSLVKFNLHPNSFQVLRWFWIPEEGKRAEQIDRVNQRITGKHIEMERDMFLNSPAYDVLSDVISNVFFASGDGYSRLDELADLIMRDSRQIIGRTSSNNSVEITMEIRVFVVIITENKDMMKYLKKRRVVENSTEESCCPICFEKFMSKTTCLMPCLHPFHEDCLAQWLERNYRCPMCRFDIGRKVIEEESWDEGEEDIVP